MNKRELTEVVAGELSISKAEALRATEAVLEAIVEATADGDKVSIAGFGIFEAHHRPARSARNPATGQMIEVAPSVVPKFRPGAGFRAVVTERSQA